VIDWVTTKIASNSKGLPHEHATYPHLGPQRHRRLLRCLRRRRWPGPAGPMQPPDRLPARSADRTTTRIRLPTSRRTHRRESAAWPATRRHRTTTRAVGPLRSGQAPPGGHRRLRRRRQHTSDRGHLRGPAAVGTRPRPLDDRSLGQRRGQEGQTDPQAARRRLRQAGRRPRPRRDFFATGRLSSGSSRRA